jgi:hypothetical protein
LKVNDTVTAKRQELDSEGITKADFQAGRIPPAFFGPQPVEIPGELGTNERGKLSQTVYFAIP